MGITGHGLTWPQNYVHWVSKGSNYFKNCRVSFICLILHFVHERNVMNKSDIEYCNHWQMNTPRFARIVLCLLYLMQPTSAATQPNMMTSSNGNIFRVTGLLCGEFTGDLWIPRTKASDAELWCFLWSVPEPKVEQTRLCTSNIYNIYIHISWSSLTPRPDHRLFNHV